MKHLERQNILPYKIAIIIPDGHGSTRMLIDMDGGIQIPDQVYAYDAYGNAIGFDPELALTTLLYSGEQTDAATGLQYLRDRYYDPASGRFTRMDSFFGTDPLSLHKYAYTFGDPIHFADPSGQCFTIPGLMSMMGNFGGRFANAGVKAERGMWTARRIQSLVDYSQMLIDIAINGLTGDYIGVIRAITGMDPSEISGIAKTLKNGGLSDLSEEGLEKIAKHIATIGRPITIPINIPEKGTLGKVLRWTRKVLGGGLASRQVSEFIGEVGTYLVMNLLGFKDPRFAWQGGSNGPDFVLQHQSHQSIWAIVEAKGGTGGLEKKSRLAKYPIPKEMKIRAKGGPHWQMGAVWIEYWLRHMISHNSESVPGQSLEDTFEGEIPMFTSVTSLNLARKSKEILVGVQIFVPERGKGYDDWPKDFRKGG